MKIGEMRSILSILLISLSAMPAFSQARDQPTEVSSSRCEKILDSVAKFKAGEDFAIREIPDGCVVSNGAYEEMSMMGWAVDRLVFEIDGLHGYLSESPDFSEAPPRWGRVAVDGVRMALRSNSKLANYISAMQQWPMDFAGSYRLDPESGYFHLQNLEVSSTKLGKASVSAEINLPVGSSIASLTANPTATLTHLRLRLDNHGLWESVALPALANYAAEFSGGSDSEPEADITRLRDISSKVVEALPESQIDAVSRKSLLRFVQDMPTPTGFFTMDVHFDQPLPIGSDDLDPEKLAQTALKGGKISVSYKAR